MKNFTTFLLLLLLSATATAKTARTPREVVQRIAFARDFEDLEDVLPKSAVAELRTLDSDVRRLFLGRMLLGRFFSVGLRLKRGEGDTLVLAQDRQKPELRYEARLDKEVVSGGEAVLRVGICELGVAECYTRTVLWMTNEGGAWKLVEATTVGHRPTFKLDEPNFFGRFEVEMQYAAAMEARQALESAANTLEKLREESADGRFPEHFTPHPDTSENEKHLDAAMKQAMECAPNENSAVCGEGPYRFSYRVRENGHAFELHARPRNHGSDGRISLRLDWSGAVRCTIENREATAEDPEAGSNLVACAPEEFKTCAGVEPAW
jgi:hypothetical protein